MIYISRFESEKMLLYNELAARNWVSDYLLQFATKYDQNGDFHLLLPDIQRQYRKFLQERRLNEKKKSKFFCSNSSCKYILLKENELKSCERCKVQKYCSYDCQKIDWETNHKNICNI